jgi:dolichol kinase
MRRRVVETAVLLLEIFIIMFLVHKEFIHTLLVLLLITLITLILFELIKPFIKKKSGSE